MLAIQYFEFGTLPGHLVIGVKFGTVQVCTKLGLFWQQIWNSNSKHVNFSIFVRYLKCSLLFILTTSYQRPEQTQVSLKGKIDQRFIPARECIICILVSYIFQIQVKIHLFSIGTHRNEIWDLKAKLGLFWGLLRSLVPIGTKSQIWDHPSIE